MWPFTKRTEARRDAHAVDGARRADGWFSSLSGFGTSKDKRTSVGFSADLITDGYVEHLWRGDDLAARIIETIPKEALRNGFKVTCDDKEVSEAVHAKLEELETLSVFMRALMVKRAYGGAAIWPVINDSQGDFSQPLNEKAISGIDSLVVFEPRELRPEEYYTDPFEKKFGEPKTYRLYPMVRGGVVQKSDILIHESRLIIFRGVNVSRAQITPNGWDDSVICRVWNVLRDFNISWSSTSVLLHEFAQASFKFKGLAQLMAEDKDDIIKARIRAIELSRSTINAVMMDSEEEYERKQTPTSGLAELLAAFATRLAAAADMPVTLLMGQSPAGLNATGESDIRFFYDRIKVVQTLEIFPQLQRLIKLIFLTNLGVTNGVEPEVWSIEFVPLWQPTEKEVAETRKIVADTDVAYIEAGIVDADDVARARFGGDTWGMDIHIDFDERDKLEETSKEAEEEYLAEQSAQAPANGAPTENVAASAMNGAQVSSLMEVVSKVVLKEISRKSAIGILKIAFRLTESEANEILGPEDFEPAKPEPPVTPPFAQGTPPNGVPVKKGPEGDNEDGEDEDKTEDQDQPPEADAEDEEARDDNAVVVEEGPGQFCIYAEDGETKLGGPYTTRVEAETVLKRISGMNGHDHGARTV